MLQCSWTATRSPRWLLLERSRVTPRYLTQGSADSLLPFMTDLLYSLTGFGIGLLVGMTGLAGGSLLTPLLILLFGIHPATAVGTDLLYSAATKTAGSVVHGLARNIEWQVVRRLPGR